MERRKADRKETKQGGRKEQQSPNNIHEQQRVFSVWESADYWASSPAQPGGEVRVLVSRTQRCEDLGEDIRSVWIRPPPPHVHNSFQHRVPLDSWVHFPLHGSGKKTERKGKQDFVSLIWTRLDDDVRDVSES